MGSPPAAPPPPPARGAPCAGHRICRGPQWAAALPPPLPLPKRCLAHCCCCRRQLVQRGRQRGPTGGGTSLPGCTAYLQANRGAGKNSLINWPASVCGGPRRQEWLAAAAEPPPLTGRWLRGAAGRWPRTASSSGMQMLCCWRHRVQPVGEDSLLPGAGSSSPHVPHWPCRRQNNVLSNVQWQGEPQNRSGLAAQHNDGRLQALTFAGASVAVIRKVSTS
jgi:hypothetical protein